MKNVNTILERTLHAWTDGKDPVQARISIFEHIRDIPYAVVPGLIDYRRYVDILEVGRGSCTPKHFLLAELFQRLGLLVLFSVYPYRWGERSEIMDNYPAKLKQMAELQPLAYHMACQVEIDGHFTLVDATLDAPLAKLPLMPVNLSWDGFSDTQLPMTPVGEIMTFHPLEARRMKPVVTPSALEFYDYLNACMDEVRQTSVLKP